MDDMSYLAWQLIFKNLRITELSSIPVVNRRFKQMMAKYFEENPKLRGCYQKYKTISINSLGKKEVTLVLIESIYYGWWDLFEDIEIIW